MKLVSAAKLRRAQEAILNQRPYARGIQTLLREMSRSLEGKVQSKYFARSTEELGRLPIATLVVVTSDRGLCGSFNANVIKAALKWIQSHENEYSEIRLEFLGRRGNDFFRNRSFTRGRFYDQAGGRVTFAKAQTVSSQLLKDFESGKTDEVKFVFNEFKNAVTQVVRVENFLPVQISDLTASTDLAGQQAAGAAPLVKPNAEQVFSQLLEKNFPIQVYRFLLESQAGEHGARMSAMENATKNAGEMIRKLTLAYNKQRQAGITKELLEIISGSESQAQAN
jgi:F-type H+-transporting ATPase subunit gamma